MPFASTNKNWNHYVANAETIARSPGFKGLRDAILERSQMRADETALDLGSGTGLLTLPAAATVERIWALDISQGMCDYLAAKALSADLDNVEPVVASIVSIPLVDASIDVVISNYCFHHLGEAGKLIALEETLRVLRPGGRLVVGDMMFSMALSDGRNRDVVGTKVRGMLAKGPAGAWRLARNGGRYLAGRWEKPATPEWWRWALPQAGFDEVEVTPLDHEGGIAVGRKPGSQA